jgi:hypothetical protein
MNVWDVHCASLVGAHDAWRDTAGNSPFHPRSHVCLPSHLNLFACSACVSGPGVAALERALLHAWRRSWPFHHGSFRFRFPLSLPSFSRASPLLLGVRLNYTGSVRQRTFSMHIIVNTRTSLAAVGRYDGLPIATCCLLSQELDLVFGSPTRIHQAYCCPLNLHNTCFTLSRIVYPSHPFCACFLFLHLAS